VWQSDVYHHYNVSLSRDEEKRRIDFVFICKTNPLHEPITLPRRNKGEMAKHLRKGIERCPPLHEPVQQKPRTMVTPQLPAKCRLIIAIQCAVSHKSLSCLEEPLLRDDIEFLWPGTHLPDKEIVIQDINRLHNFILSSAKAYFVRSVRVPCPSR
jgi:hypothetical protein